ncbi:MAG: hypothetical protein JWR87_1100 [Segetibacter sp.]|jgi:hypothetical protein|nr:hypothetical protein [Segetibacter sp.]
MIIEVNRLTELLKDERIATQQRKTGDKMPVFKISQIVQQTIEIPFVAIIKKPALQ